MQSSPSLEIHAIPHKPTFRQSELCEVLGISRATLARARGKGWLKSLPGTVSGPIPRSEVIKYATGAGK